MKFLESETTELKRTLNKDFAKEVVAFLNTRDGVIYIGVDDNGKVLGVANGAYALQEASGGGTQLYTHVLCFEPVAGTIKIYLTLINDNSFKYTD